MDSTLAAVLAVVNRDKELLLCKRSTQLNAHPGEVCLPGGKWERHDTTLTETALREAHEEVGISRDLVRVKYQLEPVGSLAGIWIHPIVAPTIEDTIPITALTINHDEVEEVDWIPLQIFLTNDNHDIVYYGSFPVHGFKRGNFHIYGLTANISILIAIKELRRAPDFDLTRSLTVETMKNMNPDQIVECYYDYYYEHVKPGMRGKVMSLVFSDDEDAEMFGHSLRTMNIGNLIYPTTVGAMRDKHVPIYRCQERSNVKEEVMDKSDLYSMPPSPSKTIKSEIKDELMSDDDETDKENCPDASENRSNNYKSPEDRSPLDKDSTPRNSFSFIRTTTERRRKLLKKIKTEIAEKRSKWDINEDPDYLDVSTVSESLPTTPFRLRSSTKKDRVKYSNLDWDTPTRNRKRRWATEERDEEEEEEEEKRTKSKRRKVKVMKLPDDMFTESDDELLSDIAKRLKGR